MNYRGIGEWVNRERIFRLHVPPVGFPDEGINGRVEDVSLNHGQVRKI